MHTSSALRHAKRLVAASLIVIATGLPAADVPGLTVNDARLARPTTNSSNMIFRIRRSGDLRDPITVGYTTRDGSARAGRDYIATAGALTIPANQSKAAIRVPILPGRATEARELQLKLTGSTGPLDETSAALGYTVGDDPFAVVTADFNGDGRPDIATVNLSGDNVSVLINETVMATEPARFARHVDYDVGNGPNSIVAVDFDGDSRIDLVTANEFDDTISILRNTTTPGASSPSFDASLNFPAGNDPRLFAAVDFNGDGRPDLLVGSRDTSFGQRLSVLTDPGPAANLAELFATRLSIPFDMPVNGAVVADLTQDGRPDITAAGDSRGALVVNISAPGATTVTFSEPRSFPISGDLDGVNDVYVANFNGTDEPELLVLTGDPSRADTRLVVLKADDPQLGLPVYRVAGGQVRLGSFTRQIALVDLDGDARTDIATLDSGSFSALRNTTPMGGDNFRFAAPALFSAESAQDFALADFNGDGLQDVALAAQDDRVKVLLNRSVANTAIIDFDAPPGFDVGERPSVHGTADFNGDGRTDLAVALEDGSFSILLNTTPIGAVATSFAPRVNFSGVTRNPRAITVADFNDDGRSDVAIAYAEGRASIFLNRTVPGTNALSFFAPSSFDTGTEPVDLLADDFNGDGKPDLAVANQGIVTYFSVTGRTFVGYTNPNISVLPNQTDPRATVAAFGPRTEVLGLRAAPSNFFSADLNADGRPDFVVNTVSFGPFGGSGSYFVMNRSEASGLRFMPASEYFVSAGQFDGASAELAGDVNRDGRPDLIVSAGNEFVRGLYLNATPAGAAFPSFSEPVPNTRPRPFGDADFNGDGKPDPVHVDASSGVVFVPGVPYRPVQLLRSKASGIIAPNADATPDPFTFADRRGVARSTPQTSKAITVSGIDTPAPIRVSGGKYSINGGPYRNGAGTVQDGDRLRVRHTSAVAFNRTVSTRLTIGGVSDTFTTRTLVE